MFTYDSKNRLKSHTNTNASNVRGNIWYDGMGRVWQRWNDNSSTEEWDATLTRFVYDSGALFQEHRFNAVDIESNWLYSYDQILQDYLREPGGIRQRDISTVDQSETDRFLLSDRGQLTARIERETSSTVQRMELSASGSRQAGGSEQDTQISSLASSGAYIESYGGTTSGATQYFDPLHQSGARHYLAGLGRYLSRSGNNAYQKEMLEERSYISGCRSCNIGGIISGLNGGNSILFSPTGTAPPPSLPPGGPDITPPGGIIPPISKPPWWPDEWPWPPPPGWKPPWGELPPDDGNGIVPLPEQPAPPEPVTQYPPVGFEIDPRGSCSYDCYEQVIHIDWCIILSSCNFPGTVFPCPPCPEGIHYLTSIDPDICCYMDVLKEFQKESTAEEACDKAIDAICKVLGIPEEVIQLMSRMWKECCKCFIIHTAVAIESQCGHFKQC